MVAEIMDKAYARLSRRAGGNVSANRPLAREISLRVGGPAAIFMVADSQMHLRAAYETAELYELPLFVLGRGTNLLVSDHGFPGIVVRLGQEFQQILVQGDELRAGGAVSLPALVQVAARRCLSGLEFAIGIPGSIGGAVILNAGAHGGCVGDRTRMVIVYDRRHTMRVLEPPDIDFGYRRSSLAEEGAVLEVALRLTPGERSGIAQEMDRYFRERKSTQPLHVANAGCVFRNPTGGDETAGHLIEQAGCKGLRVGAAEVSERHANFIVNLGGASASDVYELIRQMQERVYEASGIILEPELNLLGVFEKPLLSPLEAGASTTGGS